MNNGEWTAESGNEQQRRQFEREHRQVHRLVLATQEDNNATSSLQQKPVEKSAAPAAVASFGAVGQDQPQ